jgi:hypothetical protein
MAYHGHRNVVKVSPGRAKCGYRLEIGRRTVQENVAHREQFDLVGFCVNINIMALRWPL